jgi:hydrogenase maturation factor
VTCGDEGRLGEVVLEPSPESRDGQALVRTANGEEWVDTTIVGEVRVNDLILVHAGAAITRLEACP